MPRADPLTGSQPCDRTLLPLPDTSRGRRGMFGASSSHADGGAATIGHARFNGGGRGTARVRPGIEIGAGYEGTPAYLSFAGGDPRDRTGDLSNVGGDPDPEMPDLLDDVSSESESDDNYDSDIGTDDEGAVSWDGPGGSGEGGTSTGGFYGDVFDGDFGGGESDEDMPALLDLGDESISDGSDDDDLGTDSWSTMSWDDGLGADCRGDIDTGFGADFFGYESGAGRSDAVVHVGDGGGGADERGDDSEWNGIDNGGVVAYQESSEDMPDMLEDDSDSDDTVSVYDDMASDGESAVSWENELDVCIGGATGSLFGAEFSGDSSTRLKRSGAAGAGAGTGFGDGGACNGDGGVGGGRDESGMDSSGGAGDFRGVNGEGGGGVSIYKFDGGEAAGIAAGEQPVGCGVKPLGSCARARLGPGTHQCLSPTCIVFVHDVCARDVLAHCSGAKNGDIYCSKACFFSAREDCGAISS